MEPAVPPAVRDRPGREEDARRRVVASLRLAEAVAGYCAGQVAGGLLGPAEARAAVLDVAGELEMLAGVLRRLTGRPVPDRRELARRLVALGVSRREVANRLGVAERTVRFYLQPGRSRRSR